MSLFSTIAAGVAANKQKAETEKPAAKASVFSSIQAANASPVVAGALSAWQTSASPGEYALRQAFATRPPVGDSEDFKRILALPRRPVVDLEGHEGKLLAAEQTAKYSNGNIACDCKSALHRPCIRRLNALQGWALKEMALYGGVLGPIGVGWGKTILNILAPMAVPGCKIAVLLVPPKLQDQLGREYDALRRHFKVPNLNIHGKIRGVARTDRPVLHVVPYSRLSRPDATILLEEHLRPDLIIADEAHKLRHLKTATTSRVARYMANNPQVRMCDWSGTLTTRSLRDYAHLGAWTLKAQSPVPLMPNTVEEWATAIDPSSTGNAPPGVLHAFCAPGESFRSGFQRRLLETPGVVSTKASPIDATLVIDEQKAPPIPDAVLSALSEVRKTAVRPDGEELVNQMQVVECARQIAQGFYYRWRFPRGEPEKLIYEWLDARKAWSKELRDKLEHREPHIDSPMLCRNAAMRAWPLEGEDPYNGPLPVWKAATWPRWREVKDKVKYYTEAVWVDDYLARDAAEWARKHKGLVWFSDIAFGQKVAELAGLPCYDGRASSPQIVEEVQGSYVWREDGKRSVILSVDKYGTGTDGLQHRFSEQLVASPPSSGGTWEQMLGRLHRIGQPADEVVAYVYRHTAEMASAVDKAVREAKYIEDTLGTHQKLLLASTTFEV